MKKYPDKTIILIGARTLYNEFLLYRIKEDLRCACGFVHDIADFFGSSIHPASERTITGADKRLYLIDGEKRRIDTLLISFILERIPEGSSLVVYNLDGHWDFDDKPFAGEIRGFLHADDQVAAILEGLRAILSGKRWISPCFGGTDKADTHSPDISLGNDIVMVERIARALSKSGDRFLSRCYTENEISYCRGKAHPALHFAGKFAAKEAVFKALRLVWDTSFTWKEIEILNHPSGAPYATLSSKIIQEHLRREAPRIVLSVSHCNEYAIATAMVSRVPI